MSTHFTALGATGRDWNGMRVVVEGPQRYGGGDPDYITLWLQLLELPAASARVTAYNVADRDGHPLFVIAYLNDAGRVIGVYDHRW